MNDQIYQEIKHEVFIHRMLKWMDQPLKNFKEDLEFCFCLGEEEKKKLSTMHPPERFGDLSTNLLKIVDMKWFRQLFPTDEDVLWTVKTYGAPAEKVEIVNGMINVWLRRDLLINKIEQIAETPKELAFWEWFNVWLIRCNISLK